jgi:hypothetical protein
MDEALVSPHTAGDFQYPQRCCSGRSTSHQQHDCRGGIACKPSLAARSRPDLTSDALVGTTGLGRGVATAAGVLLCLVDDLDHVQQDEEH